jgi:hypothetical protein
MGVGGIEGSDRWPAGSEWGVRWGQRGDMYGCSAVTRATLGGHSLHHGNW